MNAFAGGVFPRDKNRSIDEEQTLHFVFLFINGFMTGA